MTSRIQGGIDGVIASPRYGGSDREPVECCKAKGRDCNRALARPVGWIVIGKDALLTGFKLGPHAGSGP